MAMALKVAAIESLREREADSGRKASGGTERGMRRVKIDGKAKRRIR